MTGSGYRVRKAVFSDVSSLAQIERSAAELFSTMGVDVGDAVVEPSLLTAMMENGHLWVAVDSNDHPVGFLGGHTVDSYFHIAELSVGRGFQRKGIGTALMNGMVQDVKQQGFTDVSLTTNRTLPWNRPWYQRLGFSEIEPKDMGRELVKLVEEEAEHFAPDSRCVMRMQI